MNKSRTDKSIKNSLMAILGQCVAIILSFIVRTIFIKTLGAAYLGVNGLFTNILSVLSFAELGFGTAIIYSMYAPLAIKDEEGVSKLMNYYSKVYKIIGYSTFLIGILLIPYLDNFINDISELPEELPSLWIIYLLFLVNSSISYFFSYKRSIIIASQNNYIDSLNQLYFNGVKNILQIIILFVFKDFLSFLIIQMLFTFLANYSISRKADVLFPYLSKNKEKKIDQKEKNVLKRNVYALAFSKLGVVFVTGTDILLVSKFIGIIAVGVYSNYYLLTNTVRILFIQIFAPITASVGNFVIEKSNDESFFFFKKIFFINNFIAIFLFISLSTLANPFINLIWGPEYVFSSFLTFLLMFNFYLNRIRQSSQIFIDAKGLFSPIKWKSLIEAIINITLSLYFLLVLKWGIEGIVAATIVSNLTTNIWWEPYVVFKFGLNKKMGNYFIWTFKYLMILIISYIITTYIHSFLSNDIQGFVVKCVVSLLVPNIIMILFYYRTIEFKYFYDLLNYVIKKRLL